MPRRRGGGSQTTAPQRKRKKGPSRSEAAYLRAVDRLGEESVKKLRDDWNSWDTSYGGTEWQQSEGIVLQLLQQGLSQIEIRAIIPVGGSRIDRLRKIHESGPDSWHTRRPQATPAHAFSDQDVEAFKMHCGTWILEDGFPCAHRRQRQYFSEPNLTWTVVHARYVDDVQRENPDARVLSYSRFTQYVHFHYPGVRLTKTAEDVCDCCVRLDIRLNDPDISEDEKQTILLEKNTHIDEAIAQRRFVSTFVKTYAGLHAPSQQMPSEIIPETFDSRGEDSGMDMSGVDSNQVRVQVQAEDLGGGISMPHYGHSRLSADYFNSNLIIQNFVVADISNERNNVHFYDERAQGKGADALCSLRLLYHLTTLQNDARNGISPAKISFSLLDNCVGQNKSKVVMMFFAMLSVIFPSKKMVLYFLLPGHSHNIADRVIAWCRRATRKMNIYTPTSLVDEVNKVKSVSGIFLDHTKADHPFFEQWGTLLSKYFIAPPAGYTSNYFFEIDQGICTARKTVKTLDDEAVTFEMIELSNVEFVRKAFISELFGPGIRTI